jgi:hypothetical protein
MMGSHDRPAVCALVAISTVLALGCGGDDRRSVDAGTTADDAAAPSDAGTGGSSLEDFGRNYAGTTELSYNFLDTETFETYTPPPPFDDTATIDANSDLTEITVTTSVCVSTAMFFRTDEETGVQIYDGDPSRTTCDLTVNGEQVEGSTMLATVFWGPESLRFFVGGSGTITNSESLYNIEFLSSP